MRMKELSIADFRSVLSQIIRGDRLRFPTQEDEGYMETLNALEQYSDEQLSEAKLFADLGLDSLDVWEMTCMFETDYGVYIDDYVEEDFGTGVGLTVRKYLEAVNAHQEQPV